MRIKRIIQRHFTFSYSERLVVIYLSIIILIMALSQNFLSDLFSRKAKAEFEKEHLALRAQILQNSNAALLSGVTAETDSEISFDLFYFNPNTISISEWIKLGIPEKTAGTIMNYVSKGGKFYKKTDLLKIYGFTEADFERLYPYILLENTNSKEITPQQELTLYPFNPNKITVDEWIAFGINAKVAERIVNYLNKGGSFKSPDDLLKIYDFEEQDLITLSPYLYFEQAAETFIIEEPGKSDFSLTTTEINLLTVEDLIHLGFNQNVARNFINYRNKLGGYYSFLQVYRVYGIDKEMAEIVFNDFSIDTMLVKKLSINTSTEEELKNHPYISDELALGIINYRNATGKFYSIYEIHKAGYISKKTFENLAPYLKL